MVIAGDFNDRRAGRQVERHGYTWVTRDIGATTRFLFFGMHFDHILTRGMVVASDQPSCGVVENNRAASDHRPIWAVLLPARVPAGRTGALP